MGIECAERRQSVGVFEAVRAGPVAVERALGLPAVRPAR